MTRMTRRLSLLALLVASCAGTALAKPATLDVTRATLDNGLRVVIVRDTLAPVVTTQVNYLVGSNEVPKGFPGSAHATEHMMFRGSPGLTKDQLSALSANMGGDFNADTHEGVTRYYFTVPAQDLDVALRIHAIRMRGVDMKAADWAKERGAIEQEVSRDMSNPGFKFITELRARMFKGSPYAHTPLGTRPSFDKTTAAALKKFHDTWYAPNNAILVIAGDVDPDSTLAEVRKLFGSIPRKALPARPAFHFQPVQAHTVKLPTDSPYGTVALTWRMPGMRDKDYATAMVLASALGSQRASLYEMGLNGKALFGGFSGQFLPHAGIGFAVGVFPRGGNPQGVLKTMQGIMADVAAKGVPADLVTAAKNKAIADLEYKKNSVPGLANAWSTALAFRKVESPDAMRADIAAVTPDEVNALARRIFQPDHAITAILTPTSSGKPVSRSGFGGAESFGGKPSGPVTLPAWAKADFATLKMPGTAIHPTEFTLKNGLHLIVQPEKVSHTVEVFGNIKTNADLQAPRTRRGVSGVLGGMFSFGTQHMDRMQFQQALDAISAHESAGTSFSLAVPAQHFEQGLKLLADNELHPAMPMRAFEVMQRRQEGIVAGMLRSPSFLNTMHLDRALYPSGDPILAHPTIKTVASLMLSDVKHYYASTFRPDMTSIVVIGDVTPEQARKAVEAAFGGWTAKGPKPDVYYPAVPPNKPSQIHTPDSSAVQDSVTLAQTIPMTRDTPQRYALILGNQVLSGGVFASRLWRDLRVKGGLVYGVSSGTNLDKNRSLFKVSYGCDPDKVGKARDMVVRDIKQMQDAPVTAQELHTAKGMVLRQYALSEASFGSIAGQLLSLSQQGKPLDTPIKAQRAYLDMTAAKIQAAFKKYLRPDAFVTAVKGPAPKG